MISTTCAIWVQMNEYKLYIKMYAFLKIPKA